MTEPKRLKCFVLSIIGEDDSQERVAADKVLKHLVKKALGEVYDVTRSDGDTNPSAITPTIVASILEADLVVADLSGANPNVFYELAIAHGYSRPTVHIQRATERAPFDVKDMRIVRYNLADPDELETSQKRLAEYAKFARENPGKLVTPLSSAARFLSVAGSVDPVAESNVQVMEALDKLSRRVTQVMRTGRTETGSGTNVADITGLTGIIRKAVDRKALTADDFSAAITHSTGDEFDQWIHDTVQEIDPFLQAPAHNRIVMNDKMFDDWIARQADEDADPH